MGRNNRQRRADKARKRSRQAPRPASARCPERPPRTGDPGSLAFRDRFVAAVYAECSGDAVSSDLLLRQLAEHPAHRAAPELATLLEAQVTKCWDRGWQPADLARLVDRDLGTAEAGVLRAVIAAEAVSYEELGARVAPAWMAQLDHIGATRRWDPLRPYLLQVPDRTWSDVLAVAVRVMAELWHLPVVPRHVDPPSAWREGPTQPSRSLPGGVLDKVRALLAKAESTSFDAEAEAFTAKAQELMARHRIDRALLDATAGGNAGREAPAGQRIGVDDPYAEAKAALLGMVADANGCRAVWSKHFGFSTVFGLADDLAAVEELYTSLLVQATAALRREGSKRDATGRSRTTRFRRSFLVAFAVRIGQRLKETVDATVSAASAEAGTSLVPILAARDEAAGAAAEAAFPEMGSFSPAASDGEGWFAGTLFGDRADLAAGPRLSTQPDTSINATA